MEQVLLVVQVLVAVALIAIVLIQRSDSDGFGLGGGSGNNLLSGRGTANLLTRTTAILATIFILNSLALSVIAARGHAPSIVDTIEEQQSDVAPTVPVDGDVTKPDVKAAEKVAPSVPNAEVPQEPVVHKKEPAPKVEKSADESESDANAESSETN